VWTIALIIVVVWFLISLLFYCGDAPLLVLRGHVENGSQESL
jgi:hypothetical protein